MHVSSHPFNPRANACPERSRRGSHACTSAVYNFARHHIREGFTRVGCEDTTDGDTMDGGATAVGES